MVGELERFTVVCVRYSDDPVWNAEVTLVESDLHDTGRRFTLPIPVETAEDIRLGDEFSLVAVGRDEED